MNEKQTIVCYDMNNAEKPSFVCELEYLQIKTAEFGLFILYKLMYNEMLRSKKIVCKVYRIEHEQNHTVVSYL